MYTVAEDVEDDHYEDLVDTLRFLFDDDAETAAFERDVRAYREALSRSRPGPSRASAPSAIEARTAASARDGANRAALEHTRSQRHAR